MLISRVREARDLDIVALSDRRALMDLDMLIERSVVRLPHEKESVCDKDVECVFDRLTTAVTDHDTDSVKESVFDTERVQVDDVDNETVIVVVSSFVGDSVMLCSDVGVGLLLDFVTERTVEETVTLTTVSLGWTEVLRDGEVLTDRVELRETSRETELEEELVVLCVSEVSRVPEPRERVTDAECDDSQDGLRVPPVREAEIDCVRLSASEDDPVGESLNDGDSENVGDPDKDLVEERENAREALMLRVLLRDDDDDSVTSAVFDIPERDAEMDVEIDSVPVDVRELLKVPDTECDEDRVKEALRETVSVADHVTSDVRLRDSESVMVCVSLREGNDDTEGLTVGDSVMLRVSELEITSEKLQLSERETLRV
jgi:hypothetical protein